MFTFNPDLARDDEFEDGDEAFDTANLPVEDEGEDGTVVCHCVFVLELLKSLFALF